MSVTGFIGSAAASAPTVAAYQGFTGSSVNATSYNISVTVANASEDRRAWFTIHNGSKRTVSSATLDGNTLTSVINDSNGYIGYVDFPSGESSVTLSVTFSGSTVNISVGWGVIPNDYTLHDTLTLTRDGSASAASGLIDFPSGGCIIMATMHLDQNNAPTYSANVTRRDGVNRESPGFRHDVGFTNLLTLGTDQTVSSTPASADNDAYLVAATFAP